MSEDDANIHDIRSAQLRAKITAYLNSLPEPSQGALPGQILDALEREYTAIGLKRAGAYWHINEMARQGLIEESGLHYRGHKKYVAPGHGGKKRTDLRERPSQAKEHMPVVAPKPKPKPPATFTSHQAAEPIHHYQPTPAAPAPGLEVMVGGVSFVIDTNPKTGRRRVVIE